MADSGLGRAEMDTSRTISRHSALRCGPLQISRLAGTVNAVAEDARREGGPPHRAGGDTKLAAITRLEVNTRLVMGKATAQDLYQGKGRVWHMGLAGCMRGRLRSSRQASILKGCPEV